MSNHEPSKPRAPGTRTLAWIGGLLFAGSVAMVMVGSLDGEWAWGALAGWAGAGVLGLCGWWTNRRALAGSQKALLKYMVGGILARMLFCGVFTGVIVGTGWLERNGYVGGLLVGIVVFMGVEIGGLQALAKRGSARLDGFDHSANGVTGRVC